MQAKVATKCAPTPQNNQGGAIGGHQKLKGKCRRCCEEVSHEFHFSATRIKSTELPKFLPHCPPPRKKFVSQNLCCRHKIYSCLPEKPPLIGSGSKLKLAFVRAQNRTCCFVLLRHTPPKLLLHTNDAHCSGGRQKSVACSR